MDGQSQPAGLTLEELPQQINGLSLEKVQQYYRKLRYFILLLYLKICWEECSMLKTLKLMKKIPLLLISCPSTILEDPHCVRNPLIFFPQLSLFWSTALYRMRFLSDLTSEGWAELKFMKCFRNISVQTTQVSATKCFSKKAHLEVQDFSHRLYRSFT